MAALQQGLFHAWQTASGDSPAGLRAKGSTVQPATRAALHGASYHGPGFRQPNNKSPLETLI
jgi:hypothetical protein